MSEAARMRAAQAGYGTGWMLQPSLRPGTSHDNTPIEEMSLVDVRRMLCSKTGGNPAKCNGCKGLNTCKAGQRALELLAEDEQRHRTTEQDRDAVLSIMETMLTSLESIAGFTASPLYTHMTFQPLREDFLHSLREDLLACFSDPESYGFLSDDARYQALLHRK